MRTSKRTSVNNSYKSPLVSQQSVPLGENHTEVMTLVDEYGYEFSFEEMLGEDDESDTDDDQDFPN